MTASTTGGSSASPSKIGLVGGTFNPIHRCHLVLAREVRDRLGLDKILFIPTGDPPHKRKEHLASAEHRLAMVRLAIEGEAGFAVTDIEVRRSGVCYSIDTVTELGAKARQDTPFHFCLGLDAFLELSTWHRAEDLLAACHFVVVSRPGVRFGRLSTMPLLPSLDGTVLREMDEGRTDCAALPLSPYRTLYLLTIPPCPVSASMVRERIAGGRGAEGLLPTPVERYIIRERLYQGCHNPTRLQG